MESVNSNDTLREEEIEPPEETSERIKRIGCTALTVILMFFLLCAVVYFITGLSAIFVNFYNEMT